MKTNQFEVDHINGKDEWLTPPNIVQALGPFDLDPCAPVTRPWPTAARHFTVDDNGLIQPWHGFVWCNPPYGNETGKWLRKMAQHNNGIALIFARTETNAFFDGVWNAATSCLFLRGRLKFYHVDGTEATNSAGAPSVLVAYGQTAAERLKTSGLAGKIVTL